MIGRPSVTFTPSWKACSLSGNQALIVIHAQHGVPLSGGGLMKHGVRRESGRETMRVARRVVCGEFADRRRDQLDFLAPQAAVFHRRGGFNPATAILTGRPSLSRRNSANSPPTRTISVGESCRTASISGRCVLARTTVSAPPVNNMAKFFRRATRREELGLAREREAEIVQATFAHGTRDDGGHFTPDRGLGCLLQSVPGRSRRLGGRLAGYGLAGRRKETVIEIRVKLARAERRNDDFRPDPRRVADRDGDDTRFRKISHAATLARSRPPLNGGS